jgi:hypothetical protein
MPFGSEAADSCSQHSQLTPPVTAISGGLVEDEVFALAASLEGSDGPVQNDGVDFVISLVGSGHVDCWDGCCDHLSPLVLP